MYNCWVGGQGFTKKHHALIKRDMNMVIQTWNHGSKDKTKWYIHNKMVNILNENNDVFDGLV
jgi:hypothetical protein